MKKMRKLQIATLLLGVSVAVAGFAVANENVQASETETQTSAFAMEAGAAVRTKPNDSGIRWITNVDKSWYESQNVPAGATVQFGTFVTSASNVSSIEELDENFATEKRDIPCETTADFTSGTFTYYSAITFGNITDEATKKAAFATELVARSYMKYSTDDGVTWNYKYADSNDNQRCIRAVALEAIEDTEEFNKLPTDDDRNAVKGYVGASSATAVDFDGYYETANAESVATYTDAYLNAKKVGMVSEGILALNDDLTLGKDYELTLFDANGNYAKTSMFKYVTQAIDDATEFTTSLGSDTENTVPGYYVMNASIVLTDVWSTPATFSGTLDGQGYTITGLQIDANSGLFTALKDATIKNVSVIDAVLNGKDAGVFASKTEGAVTFENVYVSIADTTFGEYHATESEKTFVLDDAYGKGGLLGQSTHEVAVKDSVIYMPEFLPKAHGFVAGQASATITIEDSTFIGGNGRIYGERSGAVATVSGEPTVCDAVAAYKALYGNDFDATIKENVNGWSDMQIASYEYNHALKVVGESDVADTSSTLGTFRGLTNEIVVLTADVLFEDGKLGGAYNSEGNFTGVFDGQNHKITGLKAFAANTRRGGIFYTFTGSLKNVSLQGQVEQTGGVIAQFVYGTAYLENVYVEAYMATASAGGLFARVGEHSLQTSLSMKNVVINADNDNGTESQQARNGAIIAYGSMTGGDRMDQMGVYMENCSYVMKATIEAGTKPIGLRPAKDGADALSSLNGNDKYFFWDIGDTVGGVEMTEDDGLTYYESVSALKENETDLTEFLKGILNSIEEE